MIIPTLNEADRIGELILQTRALGDCEIIVVDGGSADDTLKNAGGADRILSAIPGRAIQQNIGAAASSGEILLFLHADCVIEPGGLEAVRSALSDQRVVGGCFRQRIHATGVRYRLLERGNALRVRLLKWAYGDQAIFVRRDVFKTIDGFPALKLMEDLYLMKRLKRQGRIALLDSRVQVSARRWQQEGVVRQTLRNWTLLTLTHLGVSPDRLTRFYSNVR